MTKAILINSPGPRFLSGLRAGLISSINLEQSVSIHQSQILLAYTLLGEKLQRTKPIHSPLHRQNVSLGPHNHSTTTNFIIFNSPYYIWLGRPRSCDVTQACHAFEIEGGNFIGNCSPTISQQDTKESDIVPALEIGQPVLDLETYHNTPIVIEITAPLSSFHYQVQKVDPLPSRRRF